MTGGDDNDGSIREEVAMMRKSKGSQAMVISDEDEDDYIDDADEHDNHDDNNVRR